MSDQKAMSSSPDDETLRAAGELLVKLGISRLRNGRVTLHLDGEGLIQDVEVNFKRKLRKATR
jgi:hypothetical protein